MKKLFYVPLIFLILGCTNEDSTVKASAPDRPENVPKSAFWQGGLDGGAWYQCSNTKKDLQYYCTIYNDFTGEIIIQDNFDIYVSINQKYILLSDYINVEKLTGNEINAFNGVDEIYLNGSLLLKSSTKYELP